MGRCVFYLYHCEINIEGNDSNREIIVRDIALNLMPWLIWIWMWFMEVTFSHTQPKKKKISFVSRWTTIIIIKRRPQSVEIASEMHVDANNKNGYLQQRLHIIMKSHAKIKNQNIRCKSIAYDVRTLRARINQNWSYVWE